MSQPTTAFSQNNRNLNDCFFGDSLGFSDESIAILSMIYRQRYHVTSSVIMLEGNVEAKFYELKNHWEAETEHLSSITEISMHPSYQKIIGLGEKVLPLIFRALDNDLNHWFWALKSITGADPVPRNKRGKMKQMQKAWLEWWRVNKNRYMFC